MLEQEMSLKNKVAVISGAGKGLGRAIAIGFAEAGADVVAISRTAKDVEILAEEIRGLDRRALGLLADMTDSRQVDAAIQRAVTEMGHIDILVNSVGEPIRKSVLELTDDEWDGAVRSNLTSTFYTCRASGRHFIEQKSGRIINIASTAGKRGRPGNAVYSAAKAAVINFSRALACEWAPYGINVNVLCPGRFLTPLTAPMMEDADQYQAFIKNVPLRRIGSPEEIKIAAVFLASNASSFMTGETIVMDGGQTLL